MLAPKYVRCVIFTVDNDEVVNHVKIMYDEDNPPTIGMVKQKAQEFLEINGGTAKTKLHNGKLIELEDCDLWLVEDKIWLEFKENTASSVDTQHASHDTETSGRSDFATQSTLPATTATSDSEDAVVHTSLNIPTAQLCNVDEDESSSSYQFVYDGKEYNMVTASTYGIWSEVNKVAINELYGKLKPSTEVYVKQMNAYDYFKCNVLRAAVVLSKWYKTSGNDYRLHSEAQEKLYRGLVKLIDTAYNDEDLPYKDLPLITEQLYTWLQLDILRTWSNGGSESRLAKTFRTRKWRKNKNYGTELNIKARKRKRSEALDDIDFADLEKVANSIRSASDGETIRELYKGSAKLRCRWYEQLNETPMYNQAITTAVLHKFPSLQTNIVLLRYDYEFLMNNKYGKAPDIGNLVTKEAKSITLLAKNYNISYTEDDDLTLCALNVLPSIIQTFCSTAKKCTASKLLMFRNTHDIQSMLDDKKDITKAPMIFINEWNSIRTYYIAVDDMTLQIPHANAAGAFFALFQLHYALNLQYDSGMSLLFGFFEWISGIVKKPKTVFTKLRNALQIMSENDDPNTAFSSPLQSAAITDDENMSSENPFNETSSGNNRNANLLINLLSEDNTFDSTATTPTASSRTSSLTTSASKKHTATPRTPTNPMSSLSLRTSRRKRV